MKNITITLDEETAAWVRAQAAEQNKSMSRFIGEHLQASMKDRREYLRAYRRWLSKPSFNLTGEPEKYPSREEIHDRSRVR
ncbi:MAG TPA: hypothetical protein VFM23_09595 [Gemmatimonadales bacterium]|nr:hypothetical protein [Gemmatimonadales bacterium]HET9864770.1 hypothetical protein [Steroidobacteraceae bacterium]